MDVFGVEEDENYVGKFNKQQLLVMPSCTVLIITFNS